MALLKIKLAASPTSWGVDFADAPDNPPWRRVLDEIGRSGLGALELGPVGYLPENPIVLRDELERRQLRAVGSFVFEALHDPASRAHVLTVARRACRAIRDAGGSVLVIIDRPDRERAATAGRSHLAARLSRSRWRTMIDVIDELGELADQHGLIAAFHPHAGSYVEFADEIDSLLEDTPTALCLDTGHAAYAGINTEEAVTRYASRLVHMHFKDTDPRVLDRVRLEHLDFWQAIQAGVFCPLGAGVVNFPRVASALESAGYTDYATIEQDRVPGTGAPLDDLDGSIQLLTRAGIGQVLPAVTTEHADAAR